MKRRKTMPVRKVKGGFKWGKTGHVYSSRPRALAQGVAILISQGKIKVKKRSQK